MDSRASGTKDGLVFTSPDGQFIAFVDPAIAGFEHQTFGVWVERDYPTRLLGVASFGNRTAAGSLPAGTAPYNGGSLGFAAEFDGDWYVTVSDIRITTDFATASISSAGTEIVRASTMSAFTAPGLDFTGSGPVSGTGFSAPVTGGLGLSGDATGQFYGPGAEEVGGTFG